MSDSKKVLICISWLTTGGTQIQTLNLIKSLIEKHYQVVVVCYFGEIPQMTRRYEKTGAKIVIGNLNEEENLFKKSLHLYHLLHGVVRKEKPNIVHVQYMAPGAIPILLLRTMGIKNIIVTLHTAADIYPSLKLIHFLQKHCVRAFTCITLLAEKSFFGNAQLYTTKTQLDKRNHFTIYNSLSEHFKISNTPKTFNTTITLGVVSRMERIKGMDLIIDAFALIKKRFPSTRLMVVGDGYSSVKDNMRKQAIELNLNESIQWTGRQPIEELPEIYKQMDIVLIPSRSEGFGLTAIEAMSQGCVVVASNIGGLPEIIKDGVNGLLHQTENIKDIAEKTNYLIENPDVMKQMSEKAIEAVKQYSIEKYTELFGDLYRKLV
ncbi:glycosyltransferase family 4 protein [Bacteroides sp.]